MALDLTYDLQNYTPADASPVEANFNRIEQYANQELIARDGTVAMTADLQLAADPATRLAAATKQYVDAVLPVGIVMQYGGTALPPGGRWMLCDGAALSVASYPDLFMVLQYTFGGSGGSFNLPNLTGKVPVGAGSGNALGATGGSRDAVVPSHTHTIDHGHAAGTTSAVGDHNHAGVDHLHGDDHHHRGTTDGMDRANPHHHAMGGTASGGVGGGVVTSLMNPFGGETSSTADIDINHAHTFGTVLKSQTASAGDPNTNYPATTGAADRSLTTGLAGGHSHTFTAPAMSGSSGNAGVSPTNANMPPYVVMNNIIRVA